MHATGWVIAAGIALGLVAGCGQKGPLYLPDKNKSAVPPAAPAQSPAFPAESGDPDQKKDDSQQSSPPAPQ
jgi:predicted small lipoprotein YifL